MQKEEPTGLSGVQSAGTPKPINDEPLYNTGVSLINLEQAKAKFVYLEAKVYQYDQELRVELAAKRPNTGVSYKERELRKILNFLIPAANRLKEFIDKYDTGVQPAEAPQSDRVNRPSHYTSHPSGVECITITEHYDFCVGNAIKYLWRCGLKVEDGMTPRDKEIEDLKKAVYYINRKINNLEK